MKDLRKYLDSTYLKTASQAGISEEENKKIVESLISEALEGGFKLAMIRPNYVALGSELVEKVKGKLLIGTVIDFPEGNGGLELKLTEARQAVSEGVDELDFVVDYNAFKKGQIEKVKEEVSVCTLEALEAGKVVKWIIEIAALTDKEIVQLTALIKNVVLSRCKESDYSKVFVKSSTGFYKTEVGKPNGATIEGLILMLENAGPLPVKAAGGVRTRKDALDMISLGVQRLGTSSAKELVRGEMAEEGY